MVRETLSVESLTKTYDEITALQSVSLSVGQGKIVGLLGPTGAGKSTLINCIGGKVMPEKGDVKICGVSLYRDYERCMKSTGVVFDLPRFYGYMSGMANLRTIASMYGGITSKMIHTVVSQMLLDDYIYDNVSAYPIGAQKRLAMAAAMLHSPRLLVMDEALYGLDPVTSKEISGLLRRMANEYGVAMLITSQEIGDLEKLCDIVAVMENGRIIGSGPVEKLKRANCNKSRHKFLLDRPESAAMYIAETMNLGVEIRGDSIIVDADQSMIPRIINMLFARSFMVYEIKPLETTLEEAYYQMLCHRPSRGDGNIN